MSSALMNKRDPLPSSPIASALSGRRWVRLAA